MAEKPTKESLLYDFFVDEASRLGQRTDWFLIFHAILLEAFFAAADHDRSRLAQPIVAVLGVLTGWLWFMTGVRQRWLLRHLGECMTHTPLMGAEVSHVFTNVFEMRRRGLSPSVSWAQPVPTFAVVIPFAFTMAWLALLVGEGDHAFDKLAAAALVVAVASWVARRLSAGPTIDEALVRPLVPLETTASVEDTSRRTTE